MVAVTGIDATANHAGVISADVAPFVPHVGSPLWTDRDGVGSLRDLSLPSPQKARPIGRWVTPPLEWAQAGEAFGFTTGAAELGIVTEPMRPYPTQPALITPTRKLAHTYDPVFYGAVLPDQDAFQATLGPAGWLSAAEFGSRGLTDGTDTFQYETMLVLQISWDDLLPWLDAYLSDLTIFDHGAVNWRAKLPYTKAEIEAFPMTSGLRINPFPFAQSGTPTGAARAYIGTDTSNGSPDDTTLVLRTVPSSFSFTPEANGAIYLDGDGYAFIPTVRDRFGGVSTPVEHVSPSTVAGWDVLGMFALADIASAPFFEIAADGWSVGELLRIAVHTSRFTAGGNLTPGDRFFPNVVASDPHLGTAALRYQPPPWQALTTGATPLRQFPRDDALGGSPRQDHSSTSTNATARQAFTNTYR